MATWGRAPSRRVVYLKPGDGMQDGSPGEEGEGVPGQTHAVAVSPWRPLCSLARRLCAGGIGIAACLPDRVCVFVRGGGGGGIAHLITRCGGTRGEGRG